MCLVTFIDLEFLLAMCVAFELGKYLADGFTPLIVFKFFLIYLGEGGGGSCLISVVYP